MLKPVLRLYTYCKKAINITYPLLFLLFFFSKKDLQAQPIYGPELIVNGDFEDAYANWTSDLNRGRNNFAPTSGGCSAQGWVAISPCASFNGGCNTYYFYNGGTPTGTTLITDSYGTGDNVLPTITCNTSANACEATSLPDHTSGTGFSVYVDPNDTPGATFYRQSVSVEANATYQFSAWIMVIENTPNINLEINNDSLTSGLTLTRQMPGSGGTDVWQKVSATWSSGSTSGNVDVELTNLVSTCNGNDFRIDDISLRKLEDKDADGIVDLYDLDDDNDGILDFDEISCSTPNYTRYTGDIVGTYSYTDYITYISSSPVADNTSNETIGTFATGDNIEDDGTITVWSGEMFVPTSGTYTFSTSSDDWSFFVIDGKLVVDNPGAHPTQTQSGSITLSAGWYEFELSYGEITGGAAFSFSTDNSIEYVASTSCLSEDFDSDGTPNIYDLDSDDDGCTDAEEGGGIFTIFDGNILNDTLTGGVRSDGIPTVAGSNGQTIGDSQNASTQTCPCRYATGFDNDGDGIDDTCDLDDDNDGILDTAEGYICPSSNLGTAYVNTDSNELGTYDLDNNTTNILCGSLSFIGGDIGIAIDSQVYLVKFDASLPQLIKVDPSTCTETVIGNLPINGHSPNSLTFLPDGTALVGYDAVETIYRVTVSPFSTTAWATISGFTSSGDFVMVDEKIYYFATSGGDQHVLEVIVDSNFDYVSHIDLGTLNVTAWGATLSESCQIVFGANDNIYYLNDVTSGSLERTLVTNSIPSLGSIYGFSSLIEGTGCNVSCVSIDTDNDGIADHLDSDSDNDGCLDAEEGAGGFSIKNGNILNDTLTGGVDTNGVPNIAGGSGQAVGNAQDVNTQSCDCPNASGIDSDGDGIDNVCDLDDDNDGILDIDECSTNHALTGTASQNSNYNGTLTADKAIDGNTGPSEAHTQGATSNDWWEIDLSASLKIDEIVIWNRTACCSNRLSNVYVMVSDNAFPVNTDLQDAIGNSAYTYQIGDTDGVITLRIPVGINGRYIRIQKSGTNTGGDAINIYEFEVYEYTYCNTDGDGFANQFDTDSDDDGCADALEGDGGFTLSNIQNDTLTGGVESNGIPTIATSSGQAIGTAQDDTQISLVCENTTDAIGDFNNTPFETPVSGDVATNDSDKEGDTQTYALDGTNGGMNVAEGTVSFNNDGTYTFTPANNFSGETTFDYIACDDGYIVACDTTTVYLEVFPSVDPENSLIIANPDLNTVEQDQVGTGNVISNDLDPDQLNPAVTTTLSNENVSGIDEDGNTVTVAGSLTLNANGTYTFTPSLGFTGTVTKPYTICDSGLPAICDNSNLTIKVIPDIENTTFANDDAVITDAEVTATGDVSENDFDNDVSDTQSINSFLVDTDGDGDGDSAGTIGSSTTVGGINDMGTYVANAGSLTLNSNGTYTFEPATAFAGNVVVPYTACDNASPTMACDDATLVISVLDVKRDYGDAPINYSAAWHRSLTDNNDDDILDGSSDVWLGSYTDFETSQSFSASASGDSNDDAIIFGSDPGNFPLLAVPDATYDIDIAVNSTSPDVVFYGLWIDWDNNGIYEDFYSGSQATNGLDTAVVSITAPSSVGSEVNIRLRGDDDPFIEADSIGGKTNGEVEDYQQSIVLPIELLSFEGSIDGCIVDLKWASGSSSNFSHYEIERSHDGNSYSKIASIDAVESSQSALYYKFTDDTALEINYYRLKMIDLDGSYEYSKVLYFIIDCDKYNIAIYPNPIEKQKGVLNINLFSSEEEAKIEITDILGRVLKTLTLDVESNVVNAFQINISDFPSGSYTIKIQGQRKAKMFIIQE